MNYEASEKGDRKPDARTAAGADELLVIRITPGHVHLKVEGMMRVFLPICIAFIVILLVRYGAATAQRNALPGKLKLNADFDIASYIQRVNVTLGGLVQELQGVQAQLVVVQEKYGKV